MPRARTTSIRPERLHKSVCKTREMRNLLAPRHSRRHTARRTVRDVGQPNTPEVAMMFCVSPSLPYAQPCYRGRVCNSRETPRQSRGPLAPPQPPSHGTPHSARRGSAERAGDCDSVSQTMRPHSDWYRLHRSVVGHVSAYRGSEIAFLSLDRKLRSSFRCARATCRAGRPEAVCVSRVVDRRSRVMIGAGRGVGHVPSIQN